MLSTNCLPPQGNINSRIAFVYEKPTSQDYHFGGIFENRGCFFAKKVIEKYFRPYYTSLLKCSDKKCDCINGAKEELKNKHVVVMGKKIYKNFGYKEAKPGEIRENISFWYSPEFFVTRGDKFVKEFDNFCKGVKDVIDKSR